MIDRRVTHVTIGQRIQFARKEAKLTQSKLGSKMGVTNRCISMWERDLRKPKYETLERNASLRCLISL